jgi:hypothetical protein
MKPLIKSVLDLNTALGGRAELLLGGGLGLYLKQEHLRATGARTLLPLELLPPARTTQDIDLFLRAEVIARKDEVARYRAALDALGFVVVQGSEWLKFKRTVDGTEVLVDVMVGPLGEHEDAVRLRGLRARPRGLGGKAGLHAFATREALGIEREPRRVPLNGFGSGGDERSCEVLIPRAFPYALMKLAALRDRIDDEDKQEGRHHAMDLYRIVGLLTEDEIEVSARLARAYAADAIAAPSPLWSVADPSGNGFFGGVSILPTAAGPFAFAATYEFFAGAEEPYSAALLTINATTGAVVWSAPCPRTSATPVPLPDGRVVLSAGINGYGSVPSLLLYRDLGSSGSLLWDSARASWIDINGNQELDAGEFTSAGGWTNQPAIARASDGSLRLYAGTIPSASTAYAACSTLRAFNLDASGSPATLATYPSGGSSPAIAGENLYTISAAGLLAFGPTPPRADVNADGIFDISPLSKGCNHACCTGSVGVGCVTCDNATENASGAS